jgi:hypothetical protein
MKAERMNQKNILFDTLFFILSHIYTQEKILIL